ncbi:tRNA epoxyqueuosine(34) reductase QueG [Neisseria sp. Ec49-e6-T10]|uniref:tRNA epoxyqueuosine(34) reductase QueG n=1 Tax=Neisseria sp. Ec49-e6-T10 TaxID=3140744 RepID=UPI003EBE0E31
MDYAQLAQKVKEFSLALGFIEAKIASCDLPEEKIHHIQNWLDQGFYGQMAYLKRHGTERTHASYVLPQAKSIILVAMPYWPETLSQSEHLLNTPEQAYISRYALGRDYHKVLRSKLKQLGQFLEQEQSDVIYRGIVDSAPLAEVAFASLAGLGWTGKNSLLLQKNAGSLFFLGALITNLPLPFDQPIKEHCGTCNRCMQSCPTGAIISPYIVDATRCLSYLTIESPKLIDVPYRKAMGNRIYGCDDCQLVCPFNRFAQNNQQTDFKPRHGLDQVSLLSLLNWSETEFKEKMAGSPIYRIGYNKWQSNILIALGNAPTHSHIILALQNFLNQDNDPMCQEAALWALAQHQTP